MSERGPFITRARRKTEEKRKVWEVAWKEKRKSRRERRKRTKAMWREGREAKREVGEGENNEEVDKEEKLAK